MILVKRVITCYKFKVQASQQLMGELPSARVQPPRPYLTNGVDYTGPVTLRLVTTRRKTIRKGYIYIYIYIFFTKVIHIEVVKSLTTEAFLATLRRFIARRGKPKTINSDNGTNFQGASTQLHEVYNMLQSSSQIARVQDFLATEGCDLRFIPPHGPHCGELWEAAVKSVNNHLRRTLGAHIAIYGELCTILAELEACLNSRPLCALSNDPLNRTYLSPGHFLVGEPLTQVPSVGCINVNYNRLSRWQTYQQKLHHFWQRWSYDDYLQELNSDKANRGRSLIYN
jgi:hypothetical protein